MANPIDIISEEARVVIKSIRSLVISGNDASTARSIMRDYVELNGHQLPYQKFGFANLEEMLKASGEFVVLRDNGETRICVKTNRDSAHLYGLTKSQNTRGATRGAARGAAKRFIPMRQPAPQLRSAVVRGGGTTTAYSRIYQQQNMGCNRGSSGTPQKVSFGNTAKNNNGCAPHTKSELLLRALSKTSQGRRGSSPAKRGSPEANNNSQEAKNYNLRSGHSQQLPVNDLRHLLNDRNTGLSRSSVDMRQTETKPPAPSCTASKPQSSNGQAKVAVNRSTNNGVIAGSGRVIPPPVAALPLMPIKVPRTVDSTGPAAHAVGARKTTSKSVNLRLVQDAPADGGPATRAKTQSKIHDRIDLNRQAAPVQPLADSGECGMGKVAERVPPATVGPIASHYGTEAGSEFSWNDRNATPVDLLLKYSAHKGYDRPEYRYYRLKNGNIQCKVTVNRSLYSTYPAEFTNEFEGQFAAALNAIEAIRADESRHTYEVCLESDLEVANRIYEILANRPNGMFSKRIPEAFQQTHQLLLPDHWFSIIDRYSNQLFVLEDIAGDTIVFACEQPSISDADSNTSEAQQMAVNELQLPWDKQYWDLYIANPVSTVEVWARLVGAEYSDKMDSLITDIEMSMMSADQQKADESMAAVGEYYLVSVTDCWYRVRVDEINYENKQCQCFFIDIGEKEQMALDQLYQCDPKYLELPGQAKRFTLEGLEDFCENPKAKLHLDALISGRVFIGEILTKREEYEEAEQASGIGSGQLKLALYDTSSDHDVLLNPIVLKHICDDTPEPALNRKNVNAVTISYIDDQGDVYCQMVGTMEYIQKLITNLTQSNALDSKYRGLYKTKAGDQQQLYLVKDENDGKWYRAELEAEESGPSCRMLYVDVGCRRRTNVSNIYRLEMLSLALSRYPAQAIRMRMFGLDLSEPQVLARLRALLKPAMRAIAKVCAMAKVSPIASAALPLVRVFVHVSQAGSEPGQNILVCVNDAIDFEKELELSSELISAPRISDSVLSNGSSSSSNTSSQSTGAGGGSLSSTETKDLSLRFDGMKLETSKSSLSGSSATSPTANSKAVAKLPQMTLPAVGQLFDVKVVIASSPNYFIVQPYAYAQQLNRLMHELQDFCTKKVQPVRKENVRQNEVYAALNTDGHWYRVSVINILFGPTPIHVFFCDFGRIGVLDVSALRMLPANFCVLPQQAIKAKLHGVKPLHKDWQAEDAVRFQRLTVERKFASIVRGIQADEINRDEKLVELELIDVSSEEDVYVNKTLVDEGRAVYTAAQTV